jgi:hypothetical protein
LVAVPLATVPETLDQYVEVPLVVSTCPRVPVALFESRNSPVMRSLVNVVEASVVRPVTVKVESVVVANVDVPITFKLFVTKLAVVAFTI